MALKSITSPGVQITETDLTGAAPRIGGGTAVLLPGFAAQGPVDDVLSVGSMSEFERLYGKPTNAAERYFYDSASALFNSSANLLCTRLPYGSAAGIGVTDKYTALFFPVAPYGKHSCANASNYRGASEVVTAALSGGNTGGVSLSTQDADVYLFGKPQLLSLTRQQYEDLRQGNYTWNDQVTFNPSFKAHDSTTWGKAGMIVVNTGRTAINDKYEGMYFGITDNTELNPATNFTAIKRQLSVNEASQDLTLQVPTTRRNFALSGTPSSNDDSVSEILENIPTFDVSGDDFDDSAILGIFRLKTSVFSTDVLKLDYTLSESYLGSFDSRRQLQSPAGGNPQSFFIGDVEDVSADVEIFVNKNMSFNTGSWTNSASNITDRKVRFLSETLYSNANSTTLSGGIHRSWINSLINRVNRAGSDSTHDSSSIGSSTLSGDALDNLIPLGTYQPTNPTIRDIGAVPDKLDRVFRTMENLDLLNIDVSVEGGLGTIYAAAKYNLSYGPTNMRYDLFDDELVVDVGTIDHDDDTQTTGFFQTNDAAAFSVAQTAYRDNYRSVFNKFDDFAEFKRKDHLFVADIPRHMLVNGKNEKVLDDKRRTFTQAVYWPLRHIFGHADSSYSTVFGNWAKRYNGPMDKQFWCPFSGYAAATMANNDATFGPWYAPAGFTRGRFGGVTDIAIIPSQKHRDQLYKVNINPVTQFPGEGFVIFGQKTFFRKPSAFDRLNVRRLFLHLEKIVRSNMKYFVFEPNTLLTRSQVMNTLTPIFEDVRVNQGLYDYLIICDERNNQSSTIDANELVVDIYIKPVRAAEIILVNFFASRTGQNFTEIYS